MPIWGKDRKTDLGRLGKDWEQPEPIGEEQRRFIPSRPGLCDTPKLDAWCQDTRSHGGQVREHHIHAGEVGSKTPAIAEALRQPRLTLVAKSGLICFIFLNCFLCYDPVLNRIKLFFILTPSLRSLDPPFRLQAENY